MAVSVPEYGICTSFSVFKRMSLIENLEHDNWRSLLEVCFEHSVKLLATDRFRWAGSSIDDLKSWLVAGGMQRVKRHLNDQMKQRQFSMERKVAVNDMLNQLATRHRGELLALMADEVIPFNRRELLGALTLTEEEFEKSLQLILAGGDPFTDWMREHSYSEEDIAAVYRIIDDWLLGCS